MFSNGRDGSVTERPLCSVACGPKILSILGLGEVRSCNGNLFFSSYFLLLFLFIFYLIFFFHDPADLTFRSESLRCFVFANCSKPWRFHVNKCGIKLNGFLFVWKHSLFSEQSISKIQELDLLYRSKKITQSRTSGGLWIRWRCIPHREAPVWLDPGSSPSVVAAAASTSPATSHPRRRERT